MLVAVNPFKKVPLYGNDYIEAYRCKSNDIPHVYAITDNAIREMMRGMFILNAALHMHLVSITIPKTIIKMLTLIMFYPPDEVNQSIVIRLVAQFVISQYFEIRGHACM